MVFSEKDPRPDAPSAWESCPRSGLGDRQRCFEPIATPMLDSGSLIFGSGFWIFDFGLKNFDFDFNFWDHACQGKAVQNGIMV